MKTDTKVMQDRTDFHSQITTLLAQKATRIFQDAAAFDIAVDVLNSDTTTRAGTVDLCILFYLHEFITSTGIGSSVCLSCLVVGESRN
jgi:hypothetical protein